MGASQSAEASFTSAGQAQITTAIPDGYFGVQVVEYCYLCLDEVISID